MLVISKWKAAITAAICLLGFIFALPSVLNQATFEKLPAFMQHSVNLGLELRGGSHIQLEVDLKSVEKEKQESIIDEVRTQLRKSGIRYSKVFAKNIEGVDNIIFNLKEEKDVPALKKILNKIESSLDVIQNGAEVRVVLSKQFLEDLAKRVVGESIEVIRHRIDESGTKEPTILRQGYDRIVVQLPGVEDPAEVKRLLGKTALLTFHGVDDEMEQIPVKDGQHVHTPTKPGVKYMPDERREGYTLYVPIKKQVALTGKSLVDAQPGIDNDGRPCVNMKFDNIDGARKMAELTTKYLGKQFAIVLDGKVLSVLHVKSVIPNGSGMISGSFTMKEVNELSLLLRAGSLPAPLNVVEERTVGPSLGADSIADGKNAVIFAFILVSLFMIASYGKFGGFSVISLTCNIMLLFAGLTILSATLTLPGIAGIALTIGMAVDANVLIYERIREEIRHGVKVSVAIAQGYKMALTTIIDSNLTTLVGAIVLFEFGSGPIRGFAVTLALGTIISLFTTFSVTKSIIAWYLKKNSSRSKNIVI